MFRFRVLGLILAVGLSSCGTATQPTSPDPVPDLTSAPVAVPASAPVTSANPAATTWARKRVTKLLVFVVENHSLAQMRAGMPYTFSLGRWYGYATRYRGVRHPSLPNYIAIAGGSTYRIADDQGPGRHRLTGPTVFGQALWARRTARVYAEGMRGTCAIRSGGNSYVVRHNPWTYFVRERALCRRFDVPASYLARDVARGTLPTVGMVVPNNCHNAHNCSLRVADDWFRAQMRRIATGPDWRSGRLAVVLTADEDNGRAGNYVLTVVIHPSQRHRVVTAPLNHYSLTRLYHEVAGTRPVYLAARARSMAVAFGLPVW